MNQELFKEDYHMPSQYQHPVIVVLLRHGTRMETGHLINEVSILLSGNPAVHSANDRTSAGEVIYRTLTKELTLMSRPGSPDYVQGLCRDWKGGWWYVEPAVYNTGFDRILAERLMDDTEISQHKPGKAQKVRVSAQRRKTEDAKAKTYKLALSKHQKMFCAGCGREDPRMGSFQVDHIEPLADGGVTKSGNLQLLCYPCNLAKSDKSMTELWEYNERSGMMWDKKEAVEAHKRARAMKVGP